MYLRDHDIHLYLFILFDREDLSDHESCCVVWYLSELKAPFLPRRGTRCVESGGFDCDGLSVSSEAALLIPALYLLLNS